MSSVGTTLKEARSKKSLTLDEVHAKIKIHPRVLQLLEEDKFEKLPSPLYAKSFLKSYGEFLEINTEQLLQDYQKVGQKEPEQRLFIRPAEESLQKPFRIDSRILHGAAILLAVIILGVGIFYGGKAAKNYFSHLKIGKTVKAPVKKASAPEKSAVAPKKSSQWLRSIEQGNFPEIKSKAPLELQIKALDNVWLRVTCDGKVLFQSIMKRGALESWKASDRIELWTGNSSSMFLTLNSYGLGSPGKGVIKKLLITHEGVKIAK